MEVQFIAFLVASIVIIVVPGVDFALITRQVVGYGRRAGFITLAGLVAGGLVHAALATAGLSVLLLTSAQLYTVVRVAGAAYLVFIGGKTLLGVLRAARTTPQPAATAPVESVAAGRAEASAVSRSSGARSSVEPGASEPATPARFGQSEPEKSAQSAGAAFLLGVVSNLLNVKVVVFYVTFLPQFVTPGPGATTRTAMLAMTFIGLAVAWWICYILLLDKIGRWMRRPRVERVIEGLTGAVLVGLGIKVALDM